MVKPIEICDEIIDVYSKKVQYPIIKSVILGLLAGAFVAIGGFASSLASHSIENIGVSKFVAGSIFPVGLILVLLTGTDLFTGNVLLVVPFVDKKIKFTQVIKNWIIIYISNYFGAIIIAYLIFNSGLLDTNGFKLGGYVIKVASTKGSLTFSKALSSGIMCNIIVCLAVWISYAAKDVAGKILAIWFPIMAFVISSFEHSVANMYYFSIALFAKTNIDYVNSYNISQEKLAYIDAIHILNNLLPVTIGNIIGGGLFVGLAFWVAYKYPSKKRKDINSGKNIIA
jgi:formate transporter